MTVKEELHHLVDLLGEETAKEALDYLRWLAADSETLSEDELAAVSRGEQEIARGEYVTLTDLRDTLGD
jgi:predicted transcriptional regulator